MAMDSDLEGGLGLVDYRSMVNLVNVDHRSGTVLVNASTDELQEAIFGSSNILAANH